MELKTGDMILGVPAKSCGKSKILVEGIYRWDEKLPGGHDLV